VVCVWACHCAGLVRKGLSYSLVLTWNTRAETDGSSPSGKVAPGAGRLAVAQSPS
jgi:hypothetical protein